MSSWGFISFQLLSCTYWSHKFVRVWGLTLLSHKLLTLLKDMLHENKVLLVKPLRLNDCYVILA